MAKQCLSLFHCFIVSLAINRSLKPFPIASIGMVLSFSKILEDASGNVMGTEERRQQMERIDDLMDAMN